MRGGLQELLDKYSDIAAEYANQNGDTVPTEKYHEGIRFGLILADKITCEWEISAFPWDGKRNYSTACERTKGFEGGTPDDNGYYFCQYCGGKINVIS